MFSIQIQRNRISYGVRMSAPSCGTSKTEYNLTAHHQPVESVSSGISAGETTERINACDPVEPHPAKLPFLYSYFSLDMNSPLGVMLSLT